MMKFNDLVSIMLQEMKCWKGYRRIGTKISSKTGKRVNKCVKVSKSK